jgi:hypothetical protein
MTAIGMTAATFAHPRKFGFLRRPEADKPFVETLYRIGVDPRDGKWSVWESPNGDYLFGWPLGCALMQVRRCMNSHRYEPQTIDAVVLPAKLVNVQVVR